MPGLARWAAIAVLAVGGLTGSATSLSADSLARRLAWQQWIFPQEKVHVVTDRDAYTSGDTIRFRAFLLDAMTHVPVTNGSRFVYVELRPPFGDAVERVKIRANDGTFAGMIPLPEEMAEGSYTLCGYTAFMANAGADYFFRKPLPVRSLLAKKYRLQVDFQGNDLIATLSEKGSGRHVRVEHISACGPQGALLNNIRKRSSVSLRINDDMRRHGTLKLKFDRYEKYVSIPADTADLSVTFHPEGGHLIADQDNLLAFKSLNSHGLAQEVSGTIVDSRGDPVTTFASTHRGMGAVHFTPAAGERYRALVNGQEFEIPATTAGASVLTVTDAGPDSLRVRIGGELPGGAMLLAHNCGRVTLARPLDERQVTLRRDALGSGVVQLLLTDSEANTLSSRMVFNFTEYIYGAPPAGSGLPPGDYTVRLLNPRKLTPDSTRSIVSNLLLQSEIKGHIEDPDHYFRTDSAQARADMELLMLTQGWTRYDVPAALRGNFTEPTEPMEIGGEITGRVRSRWRGKPLANAKVMVMSPAIGYASFAVSDSLGRYVVNGVDWPDGTLFAVEVFNANSNREHNFDIDGDSFPTCPALPVHPAELADDSPLPFSSAGTILLNEIQVTAPLNSEEARREMFKALGVRSVTAADMSEKHITTYDEVIHNIPGLRVLNGNVVYAHARGSISSGGAGGLPVEFWVDGTQWIPSYGNGNVSLTLNDPNLSGGSGAAYSYQGGTNNTLYEFAAMYPLDIMESIDYLKPSMSMILSMSAANGGGALVMATKNGGERSNWDHELFIKTIRPLGYQKAPQAYEPHYIYDPATNGDDGSEQAVDCGWLPFVSDVGSIDVPPGTVMIVEGLTDNFMPAKIRAN